MAVLLNREALEPALVQMAAAAVVVMLVVTPDMSDANPSHQIAQRSIAVWPQDKMPVIAHQAIGQEIHGITCQPLPQHLLERREILFLMEQAHPAVAAIEDMVDHSAFG